MYSPNLDIFSAFEARSAAWEFGALDQPLPRLTPEIYAGHRAWIYQTYVYFSLTQYIPPLHQGRHNKANSVNIFKHWTKFWGFLVLISYPDILFASFQSQSYLAELFGSDRSPRRGDVVRACVRAHVRPSLSSMSSSSILKSPTGF